MQNSKCKIQNKKCKKNRIQNLDKKMVGLVLRTGVPTTPPPFTHLPHLPLPHTGVKRVKKVNRVNRVKKS